MAISQEELFGLSAPQSSRRITADMLFGTKAPQGLSFDQSAFMQNRMDLAQAMQNMGYSPYSDQTNTDSRSLWLSKDQSDREKAPWRRMNPLETTMSGLNDVTHFLSSYSGWNPEAGWTPENIGRFVVGLPGMFASAVPDTLVHGYEALTGAPIQEANTEKGLIPDYDLTLAQRASDVGYIGAEALSWFLGPEAKIAGATAKALNRAKGISNAANRAATGAVRGVGREIGPWSRHLDAIEESAGTVTNEMRKNAIRKDFLFDTALTAGTEGAEEAFQTAADDVRFNQLDSGSLGRMWTAGQWGALGGGVAGAALGGIQAHNDIKNLNEQSPKTNAYEALSISPSSERDWAVTSDAQSGYVSPAMTQYFDDKSKTDVRLRSSGSTTAILAGTEDQLDLSQWKAGSIDFVEAYYQSPEAKAELARKITNNQIDQEAAIAEVNRAIEEKVVVGRDNKTATYKTVADALNALKGKYYEEYRGLRSALAKRPGAHETGTYGEIVGFFDGKGVITNPAWASIVGADYDSDTCTLHFSTEDANGRDKFNFLGTAEEMVLSPENQPLIKLEYTNFNPFRFDKKALKRLLNTIFSGYKNRPADESGKTVGDTVKYFLDKITSAEKKWREGGKEDEAAVEIIEDINEILNFLQQCQAHPEYVSTSTALETNFKEMSIGEARRRLLNVRGKTIGEKTKDFVQEDLEQMKSEAERVLSEIEANAEASNGKPVFSGSATITVRSGTVGGNGRISSVLEDIGLLLYTLVDDLRGNPIFRQHGQLGYEYAKKNMVYSEIKGRMARLGLGEPAINKLVATAFRIAYSSETPLNAVEGMIDADIRDKTMEKAGLRSEKIQTLDGYEHMLEVFAGEYDEGTKAFNDAQKVPTVNGERAPLGSMTRKEISGTDHDNIVQRFLKVFGDRLLKELFDEKILPEDLADQRVEDVAKYYRAHRVEAVALFLKAKNSNMRKILKEWILASRKEKHTLDRNIRSLVEGFKFGEGHEIGEKYIGVEEEIDEEGNIRYRVAQESRLAAANFVEALIHLVGPKYAGTLKIQDPIVFLENSVIGQRLLSVAEDQRTRFIYALMMRAKFGDLVNALNGKFYNYDGTEIELTEEEVAQAKIQAEVTLRNIASHGGIQARIVSQLLTEEDGPYGTSRIYNVFTSLDLSKGDVSLDILEAQYNETYGEDPDSDLFVDLLIDEDGEFSVSSVSRRFRNAKLDAARYEKTILRDELDALKALEKAVLEDGEILPEVAAAAFECAARQQKTEIKLDAVTVTFWNDLGSSAKDMEKGTNPDASTVHTEEVIVANEGNALSFLDKALSFSMGVVTLGNFSTNKKLLLGFLAGTTTEFRVYGPDGRSCLFTSRDQIFSAVSPKYDPNVGPVFTDWMCLLRRYPALAGYLAPSIAQAVTVNNNTSSATAKAQNIFQAVKEYNDAVNLHRVADSRSSIAKQDLMQRRQVEDGIEKCSVALLSDGRYLSMLGWCIEGLERGGLTLSQIHKQIRRFHRQFSEAFYYDGQNGERNASGELASISARTRAAVQRRREARSFHARLKQIAKNAAESFMRRNAGYSNMQDYVNMMAAAENVRAARAAVVADIFSRIPKLRTKAAEFRRNNPYGKRAAATVVASTRANVIVEQLLGLCEELSNDSGIGQSFQFGQSYVYWDGMVGLTDDCLDSVDARSEYIELYREANGLDENDPIDQAFLDAIDSFDYKTKLNEIRGARKTQSPYSRIKDKNLMHPATIIKLEKIPQRYSQKGIADLVADVREIQKNIGDRTRLTDYDTEEKLKAFLYDENGAIRDNNAEKFAETCNAVTLEDVILEANQRIDALDLNTNIEAARSTYYSSLEDLVGVCYDAMAQAAHPFIPEGNLILADKSVVQEYFTKDGVFVEPQYPEPFFESKQNQILVSNLTNDIHGGGVVGGVNRNGGSLKAIEGLSFIGLGRTGLIQPTPEKVDNLLKKPDAKRIRIYIGEEPYNPLNENVKENITTLGGYLMTHPEARLDNEEVLYFDPEDNPHGLWATNSLAPIDERYTWSNRFTTAIGALVDGSQEPIILKLKKKFEEIKSMFQGQSMERAFKNKSFNGSLARGDESSREALRLELLRSLKEDRRTIAQKLTEDMKSGEMEAIGLDGSSALTIAQGCTAGVQVSFTLERQIKGENGEARTVEEKVTKVCPAEYIFDGAKFGQWIERVTEGCSNASVGLFKTYAVSPEEISLRAEIAAMEYRTECELTGAEWTRDGREKRVYEAITSGWENALDNQLDIEEAFSFIPPIGWGYEAALSPEESMTPVLRYMDQKYGGESASVFHGNTLVRKGKLIGPNSATEHLYNIAVEAANVMHLADEDGVIDDTIAILREEMSDEYKRSQEYQRSTDRDSDWWSSMSELKEIGDIRIAGGKQGYAITDSIDTEVIEDLVAWCIRTGNKLLVSKDSILNIPASAGSPEMEYVDSDGNRYLVYDPARINTLSRATNGRTTSKADILFPKDIFGLFIDERRLYNPGDANILGGDDVSLLMDETGKASYDRQSIAPGQEGSPAIISESVAKNIYDKFFPNGKVAEDSVWRDFGFIYDMEGKSDSEKRNMQFAVKEYLENVLNGTVRADGLDTENAGADKCLCIMEFQQIGGKTKYAPVILPHQSPVKYDNIYCRHEGNGDILVLWQISGKNIWGDEEGGVQGLKISASNISDKGMLSYQKINVGYTLPTSEEAIAGPKMKTLDMVEALDSVESRMAGRLKQFKIATIWYFAKKHRMSYLFDEAGNVKKLVREQCAKAGDGVLEDLLDNKLSAWELVQSGEINLSEDDDVNHVIQVIIAKSKHDIPLVQLFSPGKCRSSSKVIDSILDINEFIGLGMLRFDEVDLFFHGMDQRLCEHPYKPVGLVQPMFDRNGRFRCSIDGKVFWNYVLWGPVNGIGAFSDLSGVGRRSGETYQATVRLGIEQGLRARDSRLVEDYSSARNGNASLWRRTQLERMAVEREQKFAENSISDEQLAELSNPWISKREAELIRRLEDFNETYGDANTREVYDPKDPGKAINDPFSIPSIAQELLGIELDSGKSISNQLWIIASMHETGHTYNDGRGGNRISTTGLATSLRHIAKSIREKGLVVSFEKPAKNGNRLSMPLIPRAIAKMYWDAIPALREKEENINKETKLPDFDLFVERMKEEQENADEYIKSITDNKERKAYELNSTYLWKQYGEWGRHGFVVGMVDVVDIITSTNYFAEGQREALVADGLDLKAVEALIEQNAEIMGLYRQRNNGELDMKTTEDPLMKDGKKGKIYSDPIKHKEAVYKVLDGATDLSRMMGVFEVWIPTSNIAYRGVAQTIMDKLMLTGDKAILKEYAPDSKIIRNIAANDVTGLKLWLILRDASLQGRQDELWEFLANGGTIDEFVVKLKEEGNWSKFRDFVFKVAGGMNVFTRGQFRNFFHRFAYFCYEDPVLRKVWLEKDENNLSKLDKMLMQKDGAAAVLQEIFSMGVGNKNISLLAGLRAMESVRSADIAQQHILIEMFKNATHNHPVPQFLVTTFVSRFPQYGLNITEEVLNFVMPISSMRQAFIQYVAESAHEKAAQPGSDYVDPHYERLLRNTNMREAIMADVLHFGVFVSAMILASLPGAVEPPEDEKKWGNIDEWLFFGSRLKESWWMEDILGVIAPSVAFSKSIQLDNPRIDLLVNGVANVCYSNPMLKISDAVGFMMDPAGELENDYQAAAAQYVNAPGGAPGFLEFLQAKGTTFGLSYISQFFTPTFVKSLNNWGQQYEADYKRVYDENTRGVLTESGEAGTGLHMTTYEDAMIRKLTRRNPVLALIMDVVRPGTTSYSPSTAIASLTGKQTMPYTKYLDQYQYNSMKGWSVSGLSESEAQAKVLQIIVKLKEYQGNLDALVSTGFYLDTETKAAVSSMIWDTYYQIKSQWDAFNQDSNQSDFYVLGEGDFNAGKARYYELKEYFQTQMKQWKDFYYDTMKSQELNMPMVEYRRYNTTYSQDDAGNWYATGFKPSSVLPFASAPGRRDNPEGTAGYENDFVTVSAATGLPLWGMRALVPYLTGKADEWPDMEDWASNGNGNGFSELYNKWYENGDSPANDSSATPTKSSTSKQTTGYPRSSSGGGGRGGYGGSSAPNVYAPSVSLPKANASRIMNRDRLQRPQYDYLRPDFETKGSREAYKRSDI